MSTLTTIASGDAISASRSVINTNFSNLNTDKAELSGATFTGDISVPAEVYGVGWNGSNEVPTKNDLYDKIETLGSGSVATDAIWDAKGDLAVGTGANTASRLAVGTNGQVLTADSAEATGLKWATVSGSGDMVLASVQTNSGLKTFLDTTFGLRNVANTFTGLFTNAITAARTWTLPDSNTIIPIISQLLTFSGPTAARTITLPDANFTVARTDAANTFTGVQTMTSPAITTPAITGLATGSGVASAATVSTLMTRDSNGNSNVSILGQGFTTTATAAGTTTLTIAAKYTNVFTGTTTQTVLLPTTSVAQGQQYFIVNNSTGNVTVQSSGANTIQILGAGMNAIFTALVATPTTAANWACALEDSTGVNLATTATANAATINLAYKTNTITNNSAATLTITLPTAGAIDGEMRIVRVLDFSAAAQTLTLVNTENSSVTPNASTNGSTTLPYTFGVQFNNATTKWRVIASA